MPNALPLYGSAAPPLHARTRSVHPLIYCWTLRLFPPLGYFWLMWVYKYLIKSLLSILLATDSEVEFLDHMVYTSTFKEPPDCFPQLRHHFKFLQPYTTLPSSHPHQHLLYFILGIVAILVGVRWSKGAFPGANPSHHSPAKPPNGSFCSLNNI